MNEGVPPLNEKVHQDEQILIAIQVNEVLVVPPDMTNEEVKGVLLTLARSLEAQANRDVGTRVKLSCEYHDL